MLSHIDVVVSSLDVSLPFYRGLLAKLGCSADAPIEGERGEALWYFNSHDAPGALGIREAQSIRSEPVDRYEPGLHHVAFNAPSRAVVDEVAAWLDRSGTTIEDGPREFAYTPGYYAVFFYDPDRIKLEVVHAPADLARATL